MIESERHSGKSVVLYGSAKLETFSESSQILVDGTGRVDVLAPSYFREVQPAGWPEVNNEGQLDEDVVLHVKLDLLTDGIIEEDVTIAAADTASNTSLGDILQSVQNALDAKGLSDIKVKYLNGKLVYTSSGFGFDITGVSNAEKLGFEENGTQYDAVKPKASLAAEAEGSEITLNTKGTGPTPNEG